MATNYNGITEEEKERNRIAREQQAAIEAQNAANASAAANAAQTAEQNAAQASQTTQTDTQQPLNPAAPQTPVMPQQREGVTIENGKAKIGPTNRGFSQEESFFWNQRKADRETKTKIIETGELTKLDKSLEPHREMLDERNKAGKQRLYGAADWGANKLKVDYSSIKDVKQLAMFCTTLETTEDVVGVFTTWSKKKGLDPKEVLAQGENYVYNTFGKELFPTPYSNESKIRAANQSMHSIGLYDIAGNPLDISNATTAEIIRAAQMDPNSAVGDAVYKAAKEASKIPSSIWYGMELTADMFKPVVSADISFDDGGKYSDKVNEMNASFSYSDGDTDDNARSYAEWYDAITEEYGDNPRVMKYFLRDLNASYYTHTGRQTPSEETVRRILSEDLEGQTENEAADSMPKSSAEHPILGFVKNSAEGVARFLLGMGDKPDAAAEGTGESATVVQKGVDEILAELEELENLKKPPSSGASVVPSSAAPAASPVLTGGTAEINGQPIQVSRPLASAGTMEGLTMDDLFPGRATDGTSIADGASLETEAAEPESVDVLSAWGKSKKGVEPLTEAEKNAISKYRNPETLGLIQGGYLAKGEGYRPYGDAYVTEEDAIAGRLKYGKTLGSLSTALAASTLRGEERSLAELGLMDLQAELYARATNPELGYDWRSTGENMYEHVLSQSDDLQEKVASLRASIGLANSSYSDAAVAAKEERDERYKALTASVLNNTATQETLDSLADYHAGDFVDVEGDELRNEYIAQLSTIGDYFSLDGEYWKGDSAAAVEFRNIRSAVGGGMQGAMNFQNDLGMTAQEIIDNYTMTAINMGMPLKEFLGSAGIESLDDILDISHDVIMSHGNALLEDPDIAETMDRAMQESAKGTIPSITSGQKTYYDVTAADAAITGAELSHERGVEAFYQATYMMVDEATYNATRDEVMREYYEKYGFDGLAEEMYYRDLVAVMESGSLSDEMVAEMKANIGFANSIFDIAYDIDPGMLKGVLREGRAEAGKKVEKLSAAIATFTPEDQEIANAVEGLTTNVRGYLTQIAMGALLGGGPIASVASSLVAYGAQSYTDAYTSNLVEKGMEPQYASRMAMFETGAITALNLASPLNPGNLLFGDIAWEGVEAAFRSGAGKGWTAFMKMLFGTLVNEGTEEVGELSIEKGFNILDAEMLAYQNGEGFSLSRTFKRVYDALDPDTADYKALFGEMKQAFGGGVGYSMLFTLLGAGVKMPGAMRGGKMFRNYESVKLASELFEGKVEMTEENVGRVYALLAQDLDDPGFCKWLDKSSMTATNTKMMATAVMEGTASTELNASIKYAETVREYFDKAKAAESAVETAKGSYMETRQQVMAGDVDKIPAMNEQRILWQKSQQAKNEAENALTNAKDQLSTEAGSWLKQVKERGGILTSEKLKNRVSKIDNLRKQLAGQILYMEQTVEKAKTAMEEAEAEAEAQAKAQAEAEAAAAAQAEAEAADAEIEAMSDEEIDAEVAQIVENEGRVTEAEAQSEEMGYDEETLDALKEQTHGKDSAAHREAIIRNQRNKYQNLTDRMAQAQELEDADAYAELENQRSDVQARLEKLGAGIDQETNAPEPSTETTAARPDGGVAIAENATTNENAPEPSTATPAAKPTDRKAQRHAATVERATDVATGTTKEQREAAKAVEQNKANVDAMDVETFIEQNYKDAPEKEKEGIREAWKRLRDRTPLKITGSIFEFASRVEKKFGVKIDFVDSLDGERSGEITGNRIKVARDATTGDVVRSVILHELTHKAEGGGKLYDRLSKMILDMKYKGDQTAMDADIDQKVSDYTAYYKAQNRTDTFGKAEARQEIVADYLGEIVNGNEAMIERLVRDDYTLAQKIRNIIHDVIDKFTGVKDPQIDQMKKAVRMLDKAIRKADGAQGGTKYQLPDGTWYNYSKPFEEQIKDWKAGKIPARDTLLVSGTPDVLRRIGFNNLPITIDQKHMKKIFGDPKTGKKPKADHDLGDAFMEILPQAIANPVAIIENREIDKKTGLTDQKRLESGVILVFSEKNKNANNQQIMGAISITAGGAINGIGIDANRLKTAHSPGDLTESIRKAVEIEENGGTGVYYVNKKALPNLEEGQSQVLGGLKLEGYIHSILDSDSPVNAKEIKQTETRQFDHWFKGSQIKNSDGSPKIMYRGGNEDIDIFDRKKSSYSNLYGRGFYFTESKEQAGAYGNVYSYYLSVKHPLSATSGTRLIRQNQLRAFLEAVAEDEDYGLENYGYGATVDSVMRSLKGKSDFDVLQDINATCIGDFVAAVELFNRVNDTRYDGIVTPTETVVFDSTQIKSATDNIGLFDPKNPNTKYSLPSQNALEAQILAWQKAHQAEIDAAAENDGTSQFAIKTIQNAKHVPEQVKKMFRENPYLNGYKKDTNADQLERAMNNIDQNGYDAEVSRLLDADYFSAEDTVEAGAIAISAFEEEDVATGLEMALKYRAIGSEQAQSLQSRKLFSEMSPTHVAMRVGGDVEEQLQKVMTDQPNLVEKVNKRAEKKAKELEGLDTTDMLKEINKRSSFTTSELLDAHDKKYGVPTNESQRKAIKQYGLGKVKRPGIHYNRATQEQRMLEFILDTPDLTANTGNGITGLQRLEWMREGKPVVTSVDIRYITERIKEYCKLSPYDQGTRVGDIALSRAFEAFKNCSPATFKEKHKAYRYLNMLTTLTSPGKNVVGNAGQNAANAITDETAVLFVDWLTSLATKERTHAHVPIRERINSFLEFRDEIANTFRDYFIDKVDTSPADQGEISLETAKRGRTFGGGVIGEALNGIQNVEGFLMSFGDRTFYKQAYFNSLAEQKALADRKGVELDWEEAVEQAKADADYATFNESNGIRKVIQAIRQWNPIAEFVVDYTLPFIGIPTNMLKRGFIEYTPVGLLPALAKMATDARSGRKFDQKSFANAMARSGIAGGVMVGIGFKLAAEGLYSAGTSEEDDEKLYNLRAAMGEQYSPFIRIGDEYINLSIIAPLIYPITIGATIHNLMKNEDATLLEGIGGASVAMLNQLYDASFMSTVGDIVKGMQNGDLLTSATKALSQSVLSQNLPLSGLMNQVADWGDEYQRDTKDSNTLDGVLREAVKKTIARIPWAREKFLNPKYDITGAPMRSRDGFFDNFLNVLTKTDVNDDPALKELKRIQEATGSSSHIPTFLIKNSGKVTILASIADNRKVNMDRAAGENNLILDAEQRNHYNEMYSSIVFGGTGDKKYKKIGTGSYKITGIRELMNTRKYQRASDESKAEMISEVLSETKELVQTQMVMDMGYMK